MELILSIVSVAVPVAFIACRKKADLWLSKSLNRWVQEFEVVDVPSEKLPPTEEFQFIYELLSCRTSDIESQETKDAA